MHVGIMDNDGDDETIIYTPCPTSSSHVLIVFLCFTFWKNKTSTKENLFDNDMAIFQGNIYKVYDNNRTIFEFHHLL